tara:strand:+ start:43926 stop:45479 length:1554 start_codon:yes stop_codon:yes gene_type:complete
MLTRYTASADNTIVNAFGTRADTRGTGSNTGLADIIETYSIYGRQSVSSSVSTASQELSRILVKFPINSISSDRSAGTVPASGSVSFYLKLFNAPHSKTVPRDYKLVVYPVSQSWQEGTGLDLEGYKDLTHGNPGSNWMSASNSAAWETPGGDYITSNANLIFEQTFEKGIENLEIDITSLVEGWIAGSVNNYGVGVFLSSSFEAYYSGSHGQNTGSILDNTDGAKKSYFTKRFFARGSQYFFKRPMIEARWDDAVRDDRPDFYFSSSLAPGADNLNTLYLYNFIRGRLANIPAIGTDKIMVSLFSGSADNTAPSGSALSLYNGKTSLTGGYVSTGVYSCSIGIVSSSTSPLYDVWFSGSDSVSDAASASLQYYTGSITPKVFSGSPTEESKNYILNITNLENTYQQNQIQRFNLYVRPRNWNPTIYTKATSVVQTTSIQSASYKVVRTLDNLVAVEYGTGSDNHTVLSYDVKGNYFDFDMKLLEPGYEYKFKFAFYDSRANSWNEQQEEFKFRVER